jgi:hypothetical protein
MDKRTLFDKTALNVLSFLESCAECNSVDFTAGDELLPHEVLIWEKKNSPFKLPTDLKKFYSIFNGIQLRWNAEIGDKNITIGEIKLKKLDAIEKINSSDYFFDNKWKDVTISLPDMSKSTTFVIDSCDCGEITFMYRSNSANDDSYRGEGANSSSSFENPEVWFVDRCGRFHYICPSFKQYLRLMVTHLGIRGWQLAFTPEGLPPETQQWMNIFCKERLITDLHSQAALLDRQP